MTSPAVFAAGAQELIKRAQHLGITWRLATGTVANAPLVQGSAARSSATVQSYVLMDGDTVAIAVNNMTGFTLPVGSRVYVIITPPSGNFVVGTIGLTPVTSLAATSSPSQVIYFVTMPSNVGVTTVQGNCMPASGTLNFPNQRAYKFSYGGMCSLSASTNVLGLDLNYQNTIPCQGGAYGPSGATFAVSAYCNGRIGTNTTGGVLARGINLYAHTDAGTATMYGGGINQYFLMIEDVGPAASYPNAFAMT